MSKVSTLHRLLVFTVFDSLNEDFPGEFRL